MTTYFYARAKVFAGHGIEVCQFSVTGNEIRVWDSVAGHYTSCHSMSPSTIRRIKRIAKSLQG
jgi:hypothetical protein